MKPKSGIALGFAGSGMRPGYESAGVSCACFEKFAVNCAWMTKVCAYQSLPPSILVRDRHGVA